MCRWLGLQFWELVRNGRWSGITPCVSSEYKLTPIGTQGLWVTLVTEDHAYWRPGRTTAYCRSDVLFIAFDPLQIPVWLALWRGSPWSPIKPESKPTLALGIVGSIVFCLSLLRQANACFTIVAIDQHPRKANASPSLHSLWLLCQAL